ncbi:MAG TPA: SsrA-binding protein SmpB [Candidatus Sulfotelmatobacter sp.]|nr:SsrA-binding protein SmpB [Candidatus Sulfotelmatobacter sp.]
MKITNRKASFDYQLLDHFEAGINLLGAEVKAIREGHVDLAGSFVRILGNEAYLVNAKIFPYEYARPEVYDTRRTRKLLLHKKQLISLKSKMDGANLTVVPVSMYTTHSLIKVELALAKAKRQFEKRETIKQRDIDREIAEELKRHS